MGFVSGFMNDDVTPSIVTCERLLFGSLSSRMTIVCATFGMTLMVCDSGEFGTLPPAPLFVTLTSQPMSFSAAKSSGENNFLVPTVNVGSMAASWLPSLSPSAK